ncbi:hypothetical protein [Nocardia aurantia]|uniref:Uncharacterized protein n=1 Tax=Nocardia aurantia TaxID=2585199 RepID=A0A7K0DR41_9NOCA|nr:hypothetical protein [Nocardia aurantia]MQY28233.1 hypothetical protein [Nocardia aurantia]
MTTATGVGKHYATVTLVRPPGGSAALKSLISMAESAIQTAVDLLGRGTTVAPPQVDDLLTTVQYHDLEQSETTKAYKAVLAAVRSRRSALLTYDDTVLQAAIVMSADKDTTLAAIKSVISELNALLTGVGKAKLTHAQESTLMTEIGRAVDAVYEKVTAVAEQNAAMAGSGSGSSDGGSSGASSDGSSSGGGSSDSGSSGEGAGSGSASGSGSATGATAADSSGGGLSALLPLLMMIPMGAMELAPIGMELLKRQQDAQAEQKEHDEQAAGTGGPPGPGVPASEQSAGASVEDTATGSESGSVTAPPEPPPAPATQNPSTTTPSGDSGRTGAAPPPPSGAPPTGTVPAPDDSGNPRRQARPPQTVPIPAVAGTGDQDYVDAGQYPGEAGSGI